MMENPNGSAEVVPTPKGTVLLISPWKYPISLCLKPLVTVIAAGNCCVMKPSEVAPHSAAFIKRLVEEYLDPSAFRVVLGGVVRFRDDWLSCVLFLLCTIALTFCRHRLRRRPRPLLCSASHMLTLYTLVMATWPASS